ncbi:MAG: hypothetical protein OEL20_05220 [Sulfuritalea sp.]|nr:hypothetical protein [Sulfuritalea sp.]
MQTGHYLATQPITLGSPFVAKAIPVAANFDVISASRDYVLIRYEGIRVWKPRHHFDGRAVCTAKKVVADNGYQMIDPPPSTDDVEFRLPYAPHLRRAPQISAPSA